MKCEKHGEQATICRFCDAEQSASDTPRSDAAFALILRGDADLAIVAAHGFACGLERELAEARQAISDTVPAKWRDADHDPPADEQQVLACWKGSSCIEGMETLIYCADQDGSGDGWRDVHGDSRDPPTHWTLLEMPK